MRRHFSNIYKVPTLPQKHAGKVGHPLDSWPLLARYGCARCRTSGSSSELVADGVSGQDQLYAAVLLADFGAVVAGDRGRLAVAVRFDRAAGDSLLHEVIADSLRAHLRQRLVVFVAAHRVGVSFDRDMQARVGEDDAGNFREALAGSGS